ncbi:hypothetical protein LKM2_1551 [Leptospira kirschneri serovar Mozdok]|nr:hypothetical protein [Leptospira kirschneri serovar Mozdok]
MIKSGKSSSEAAVDVLSILSSSSPESAIGTSSSSKKVSASPEIAPNIDSAIFSSSISESTEVEIKSGRSSSTAGTISPNSVSDNAIGPSSSPKESSS